MEQTLRKILLGTATAAALLVSASAHAIIFPTGTAQTRGYDIDPALARVINAVFGATFNPHGTAPTGISGSLVFGPRLVTDAFGFPETDLNVATSGNVFGSDILDYDLSVPLVYDKDGSTQIINFTPANSTVEVLFPVLNTDGNTVDINLTDPTLPLGQGLINLVLDVDINGTNDDIAFPNGRRFGDDNLDLVVVSIFKGSVGLGTAFIDNGLPVAFTQGQIDPSNTAPFATLQTAAVPVPPALGLLAGAVGLLGLGSCMPKAH